MADPDLYHDFLVESYQEIYLAAVGAKVADRHGAADGKILSPKRTSGAETTDQGASKPKPKKPKTRAKTAAKAKTKARTKANAKARPKPKAKTKARAKAKPKAKVKVKTKTRLRR
jgi:hypothetical protein